MVNKSVEKDADAKQAKGCDKDLVNALIEFQVKSIKEFPLIEGVHSSEDDARKGRYHGTSGFNPHDKYIMFINDMLDFMYRKGIDCTDCTVDEMVEGYQKRYVVQNSEIDQAILKCDHINEIKSILHMLLDKGYIYDADGVLKPLVSDIEDILKAEYAKIKGDDEDGVKYLHAKAVQLHEIHQEMIDKIQKESASSQLSGYSPAYSYDNDTGKLSFIQLEKRKTIEGNDQTSLINDMITVMVSALDELNKAQQKKLDEEKIQKEKIEKERLDEEKQKSNAMYLASALLAITAIAVAIPIINRGAFNTYMPAIKGVVDEATTSSMRFLSTASEYIANNAINSYNFIQQKLSTLFMRD